MFSSIVRAIEAALSTPKLLLRSDPAEYYRYLGDDVIEGQHEGFVDPKKPLWLNLGHWKNARTYPQAAEAMAARVAEAAQLGPNDSLLDVGFGFAEQDMFWVERFGVRHITGVNITAMQVERAQARVRDRGLAERIDLQVGSATELPFEAASFEKVTALECAHHFDTREQFFKEAFRVLKPGGTLATADGTASAGDPALGFVSRIALKRWCVPLANMYDRDEYVKRLQNAGFVNVRCESIRQYVFPGVVKYQALRQKGVSIHEAIVELSAQDIEQCKGLELFKFTGMTDYVIFSADKPR
ncbi:MAG TPA: methyltransferase domain-containing protein [Polyangiales bacterium]